jgi:hypothetical protein
VQQFGNEQRGAIALGLPPRYAPELNPVELHLEMAQVPRDAELLRFWTDRPEGSCQLSVALDGGPQHLHNGVLETTELF